MGGDVDASTHNRQDTYINNVDLKENTEITQE
jgi:hypothetical protein